MTPPTNSNARISGSGLNDATLDLVQSMAVQVRSLLDCVSSFLNAPMRIDLIQHLIEEAGTIAKEIDHLTDVSNRLVSHPSRILELFHEHARIRDAANRHAPVAQGKEADAEMEALFWRKCEELQSSIMAEPCSSAADFAAKMIVETDRGNMIPDWAEHPIWQEARLLVGMQENG